MLSRFAQPFILLIRKLEYQTRWEGIQRIHVLLRQTGPYVKNVVQLLSAYVQVDQLHLHTVFLRCAAVAAGAAGAAGAACPAGVAATAGTAGAIGAAQLLVLFALLVE